MMARFSSMEDRFWRIEDSGIDSRETGRRAGAILSVSYTSDR